MADYQRMYFVIMHAAEIAINTLIAAQREAEEIYSSEPTPEIQLLLPFSDTETPE